MKFFLLVALAAITTGCRTLTPAEVIGRIALAPLPADSTRADVAKLRFAGIGGVSDVGVAEAKRPVIMLTGYGFGYGGGFGSTVGVGSVVGVGGGVPPTQGRACPVYPC